MVFWRRAKHQLPRFPSTVIPAFRRCRQELSVEEAEKLRPFIDENLKQIRESKGRNMSLDVRLAESLADRCNFMLDQYEKLSKSQRAAVVGAIRYFAVGGDAFPDSVFATGLDDDAKIINHVLELIGMEDQCVELG